MSKTGLSLFFTLKKRETSKDSNSEIVSVYISTGKITISKEYGGFRVPENRYCEKTISPGTEENIIRFLRDNG